MLYVCNIKIFPPCCCIDQMLNFTENATYCLYKSRRSCQKHSNFGRETYETFRKPLKFALKLPNMMRMDGAGLVQNDVFAKALRMLADPYKFLMNVAIDCHAHCQILENALRMFQTLTNAVTNNTNVLQTPYK